MGRVTKAVEHLSPREILEKIKETKGFWRIQNWLIIYNALIAPRPASEIADHMGVSVHSVHKLISDYNRYGPKVIELKGRGGRWNSHMSFEEEKAFLAPFIEEAMEGKIAIAAEIKQTFERKFGKTVDKSIIYRLLKRHGWRKIVPRPVHVQTNKEKQEEFKNNFEKIVEEKIRENNVSNKKSSSDGGR
jgi:transposase